MSLYGTNLNLSGLNFSTTSSTDSTSTGAGGTVEALAGGALESIPVIGGLLSGVVGKLNIAENINLVQKYGLSSWGASSSPEEAKANFVKYVYPWYQNQLSMLASGNVGAILTEMNQWLVANLESSKYRRKNHARAESTRQALDWMIGEYQSLLGGIDKVVSALRGQGANIQVTSYQAGPKEIAKPVFEDQANVIDFFTSSTATFKRYTGDISGLKVDEEGNVKSSGGGSLLALAGIGFAILKGIK